jgi:putative iron-regulated protein
MTLKKHVILFSFTVAGLSACHKASETSGRSTDFATLEDQVITDFTNDIVQSQYGTLLSASLTLQTSVGNLSTATNEANQAQAKADWKNMRSVWEQTEGFLFGPVESNDYDPNTDTWPTDYTQMDSLLANNDFEFTTNNVKNLPQSLRGYHPLEYMIWGKGGSKTPADFTGRQKEYMMALIDDLSSNNVQQLYNDWFGAADYKSQVLTAGNGSTEFSSRKALFLNMVSAMSDICGEVAGGKMKEPYDAYDSTITESPYSSNTLIDFKNNIIGLQNVYMGFNGGKGLHDLVVAKQSALDQQIQAKISAALISFDQITERFEQAIYTQRIQVKNTMELLDEVNILLENDLTDFINTNIKD